MSTPETMDTIDEAEQAWREYKNNSSFFLDTASSDREKFTTFFDKTAEICNSKSGERES